ncbi:MAG: hypothetical protein PF517_20555 [Salinivirgaceae bacterium]|jgi:hypothetical protein|nr:hypothetical protein [Salinivirgaceae bacterium]
MQNYINQLVSDLQNAQHHARPAKMELPPELEFVRGAEEYLHGELYPMGKLFGLENMQFPPADRLNAAQLELVVNEFKALWEAFNLYPDFPEGLPNAIQYKLMVEYLNYETSYVTDGANHIEFCSYMPDECPFPLEFCQCKNLNDDTDYDMPIQDNDSEQPF